MVERLKPINVALLNELAGKYAPKVIETRIENGHTVKVYEAREANNTYGRLWWNRDL